MPKLSFMKFYPADWINDTRSLSAEAKGCWMDLLCFMWNAPERGKWEGTFQEFARVTGTPWESAPALIQELHKVATVTIRNNLVTLINRRMSRQETHYNLASERQRRWRSNANRNASVTAKTLDVRLLKTTSIAKNGFIPPTPKEAQDYALEIGMPGFDGEKFVAHYSAAGWMRGKSKITNWKACIVTWKKNQNGTGKQKPDWQ